MWKLGERNEREGGRFKFWEGEKIEEGRLKFHFRQ